MDKIEQLKALKSDLAEPSTLAELKAKIDSLRAKDKELTKQSSEKTGFIRARESQLETEPASNTELKCFCPTQPGNCPATQGRRIGASSTVSQEVAERIREEIAKLTSDREHLETESRVNSAELQPAESKFAEEEKKHRETLAALNQTIGQWVAHQDEIKSLSDSLERSRLAEQRLKKLNKQIAKSETRNGIAASRIPGSSPPSVSFTDQCSPNCSKFKPMPAFYSMGTAYTRSRRPS